MLGSLETTILLATFRTGGDAFPSAIYNRIVETTAPNGKEPAFAAVYTTIGRMAKKGLIEEGTRRDDKGRDRRTYTITGAGARALQEPAHQLRALGAYEFAEI